MSNVENLAGKPGKSKKVCLLSDHHISMNPRLWKEAFFYEKRGFNVVVINMWQSKDLLQRDLELLKGHLVTYKSYLNLIPGEINPFRRFFYRLRKRGASELQRFFKTGTGWAISHAPELMLRKALEENADLYAAHLECAFFAGRHLTNAGKKVSFDFEDWYSRDFLVPERPVKLLESLERFALQNGLFCTSASNSMALALKESYRVKNEITIIYNGFAGNKSVDDRFIHKIDRTGNYTRLLWFSRTVGPGRGIGFLLKALLVCEIPVELHLLGEMAAGFREILKQKFLYLHKHRLIVHPFMPHDQLSGFISQFQFGLAIEENINDNKSLTISNKILQYLQAGLYVLASDTLGQREVADYFPSTVQIVDINDPVQLANAIDSLGKRAVINKQEQNEKFRKLFSWEAQENKLNELIQKNL